MQHVDFLKLIRSGLGATPRLDARDNLANLVRSKGTRIFLNYDWITNKKFYQECLNNPEIDIDGDANGVTIFAIDAKD